MACAKSSLSSSFDKYIDGFYLTRRAFVLWKRHVTGKSKLPKDTVFLILVSGPATEGYLEEYNVPWRKW
jgi:hypothetical protein